MRRPHTPHSLPSIQLTARLIIIIRSCTERGSGRGGALRQSSAGPSTALTGQVCTGGPIQLTHAVVCLGRLPINIAAPFHKIAIVEQFIR
eukprot:COSAG02_NODE_710_length_18178_cov_14.361524_14_plen_90_part_00